MRTGRLRDEEEEVNESCCVCFRGACHDVMMKMMRKGKRVLVRTVMMMRTVLCVCVCVSEGPVIVLL